MEILTRDILVGIVFVVLSLISIFSSGAQFIVHFINILSLFIALVIPSFIINLQKIKKPFLIWIFSAIVGILFWDIFYSLIIVKKELFMYWYIIYPVGIISLVILQIFIQYISDKIIVLYNKY